MSGALFRGMTELESEIDQPLDLAGREPAREARHGAVALGDALPDGRAVAPPHHGRGEEVQVRVELEGAAVALPFRAVAAGAVGLVELGSRQVLPGAAHGRQQERQRRQQEERPELQQRQVLRFTRVAVAWSRGRTTISSMLTWDGRVAAQTMQSAMSSAVRGSSPR